MPIENNVGFSEHTKDKHDQLRNFLRMHLEIVRSIFQKGKATGPYYYFDLNAGPGEYLGTTGSPLIFLKEAEEVGLRYKAVFYEQSLENAIALEEKVGVIPSCQVINASNSEISKFPQLGSKPYNDKRYGLMFADPNGGHPDWESIGKFFQHNNHRSIDVLLYLSATGIKRVSCSMNGLPRLMDGMNAIGKQHWLVRRPADAHQWTFLVGTNWADFPDWKRKGFYSVQDRIGKNILDRLHYTAREYKAEKEPRQMSFAFA